MNTTKLKKWGNSQGILFPKAILKQTQLSVGDSVSIRVQGDEIIIKKETPKRQHRTLRERFASYTGNYVTEEWDTGMPVGDEIF